MSSLEAVVRELSRSAARSSALQYLEHAVLAAAAWVLAVFLAARVLPIEQVLRIAALGIPFAFGAVAVGWFASRPRTMNLMRTADLELGLQERLSTAWERRLADGPMDAALRGDALRHAAKVRLAAAFPVRFRRGEAAWIAILAATAIVLVLLPNPMDQLMAQRRADQAAQGRAATTIAAVKKKLTNSTQPAPVDPQVQKILQQLQDKVASAPDPRSALQNITPAEQQLLQLSDPKTPARATTAQNLANSLSGTNAGRIAAQAIATSPAGGAQSLRSLGSQLQSLSPQDRAQLAKALADAAQHAQDPAMAASLQQASSALTTGNLGAASAALNDLAAQFDSLQTQLTNDQEIASAINGLEASRQQLASQADRDAGQSTAPSGSPTTGSGSGQASGNGNGTGNGANGTGNGANGTGNGAGSGAGGGNGTGGLGVSGSGSGSGPAARSTERVYVPGQPVPGQTASDPTPLGPGQDVPLTPYTQVVQAYQQAALQVSNETLIPGSERDLIRQYFSSLSEPTK
ncbi:MAG: hypothetical protein ABI334_04900 [Candidatus Dormiibacterota bacterium]